MYLLHHHPLPKMKVLTHSKPDMERFLHTKTFSIVVLNGFNSKPSNNEDTQ